MKHIVRIGVGQTAKVVAILYFFMTAIFAVILAPFMLIRGTAEPATMPFGGALLLFVLIAAPFCYAILGYLGTALVSSIYNVVARRFGGIEIEIDEAASASTRA